MNFGGRTNEADSIAIINRALDADINFIDTANVYGHDPANFDFGRGRSEEIVGKALKQTGKRDRVILATKVHYSMGDDPNARGNSRRHILDQCVASLRRLQTDYIDLYQLHSVSPEIPIDETLRALDDLIRRGWVRYIGTSSFAAWQIVEALSVSKEYGLNRFISEQAPYNLLDRRIERELVPMAQTYGLAILTWSPLAGGFLAGKYRRGEPAPAESRFDVFWRGWWRANFKVGLLTISGVDARQSRPGHFSSCSWKPMATDESSNVIQVYRVPSTNSEDTRLLVFRTCVLRYSFFTRRSRKHRPRISRTSISPYHV